MESIYVGSGIRSVVDLDAGVRVTVLEPNVRGRVDDDERGNRVVVNWHDGDVISLIPAGRRPVEHQCANPFAAPKRSRRER